MKKQKAVRAWAGFENGEVAKTEEAASEYRLLAVFPTRNLARLAYRDYRRVSIQWVWP